MKLLVLILGVMVMTSNAAADSLPDFDALWDYNKPAETEARFREILAAAEKSTESCYILELKTQIARVLGLQQKFDAAHSTLDEVEAALAAVRGSAGTSPSREAWDRVRVRYLLERGRVCNSAKKKDEALPLFEQAWTLALGAGLDGYAVDAAHMLAIAAPPEQVMVWNQKALALAEKSAEPKARRWRGTLYNNIGWDYFGQSKYDSALAMFEKAIQARIEQEQPTEVRIARWCVAKTLRMMGQVDSALAMQKQLEAEWEMSGDGPDGYVFEEIAECLQTLNRTEAASPYFRRAHELLAADPWLQRDEPERLERLKTLGGANK